MSIQHAWSGKDRPNLRCPSTVCAGTTTRRRFRSLCCTAPTGSIATRILSLPVTNRNVDAGGCMSRGVFLLALLLWMGTSPVFAQDAARGAQVYEAQKCSVCHAI